MKEEKIGVSNNWQIDNVQISNPYIIDSDDKKSKHLKKKRANMIQ